MAAANSLFQPARYSRQATPRSRPPPRLLYGVSFQSPKGECMKVEALVGIAVLVTSSLLGQSSILPAPSFDIASIKLADNSGGTCRRRFRPESLRRKDYLDHDSN